MKKTPFELARGPKLDDFRALVDRFSARGLTPRVGGKDEPNVDIYLETGTDRILFTDVGLTPLGARRLQGVVNDGLTEGELLLALHRLGTRFAGFDVQFRRPTPTEWMKEAWGRPYTAQHTPVGTECAPDACWRVRVHTCKNERCDYRIVAYGETFAEAAQAALNRVVEIK
jgi:hypothetical protein